ncbi:MAG: FtsX-like permease family protein, partial [Cyclobacteriaceae bacterium]
MDSKFGRFQYALVKVSSQNLSEAIGKLQTAFKALSPDKPFEYEFLDENVRLQYEAYERWMNVMGFSTFLAIVVSCLGVFGLSGLNIVNRTKEIGLRQVLGAGIKDIFVLMNKQYVWLCLIAFVLAVYPAWYAVDRWLSNFQFAIGSTLIWFCASAVAGLVIVLLTTTY